MKERQRAATGLLLKDPQVTLSLCFSSINLPTPWNRTAWSSVKDGPLQSLGSRSELLRVTAQGIAWELAPVQID